MMENNLLKKNIRKPQKLNLRLHGKWEQEEGEGTEEYDFLPSLADEHFLRDFFPQAPERVSKLKTSL